MRPAATRLGLDWDPLAGAADYRSILRVVVVLRVGLMVRVVVGAGAVKELLEGLPHLLAAFVISRVEGGRGVFLEVEGKGRALGELGFRGGYAWELDWRLEGRGGVHILGAVVPRAFAGLRDILLFNGEVIDRIGGVLAAAIIVIVVLGK